ncbi:MATE family efflux transporter [Acidocella sp.]|uniref:MATE family efflux transporter n=1 Tax=Acidocella sp. TaxID=50710 RepID=UPI0026107837|nr:MATE family efflux transporter [Acidocella sp.]
MDSNTPAPAPPRPKTSRAARLVEGPITRTLILFSLPILASSVLQSLNASINAAWIGHLLGANALTASANANSLLFFLLSVSFGLSMAATILIGQSFGARDMVMAKRVMGTSFMFFGVSSVIIAAVGFAVAPHILSAMDTPASAAPLAAAYLRIIFTAIPAIFIFTFLMMALRGAGDSRTPFVFMAIAAVLDVTLNPLFIRGFGPLPGLGIAGSALATTIAQWLALIALMGWLYSRKHVLCIMPGEQRYLRFDGAILRSLLTKGIPMGLQVIVVSSSMIMMISLVNRYGSLTVAAYGACFQLWNYIQMPALSIGSAVSSMTAQNIGAGRWDRVARIATAGVLYNIVLTLALIAAVTFSDNAAFALFLGHNPAAIAIAKHMHAIVSWSYILFGIAFVLASVMRATGAVIAPLLILVIAIWGIRIPLATLLSHTGVDGILWGFPAGSFASMVMTFAYYRYGPWRRAHMLAAGA